LKQSFSWKCIEDLPMTKKPNTFSLRQRSPRSYKNIEGSIFVDRYECSH
jgi:hypothetical protein